MRNIRCSSFRSSSLHELIAGSPCVLKNKIKTNQIDIYWIISWQLRPPRQPCRLCETRSLFPGRFISLLIHQRKKQEHFFFFTHAFSSVSLIWTMWDMPTCVFTKALSILWVASSHNKCQCLPHLQCIFPVQHRLSFNHLFACERPIFSLSVSDVLSLPLFTTVTLLHNLHRNPFYIIISLAFTSPDGCQAAAHPGLNHQSVHIFLSKETN